MQYDPIKRSLGNIFNRAPWLRILFYRLLDLLLLRTWHVKKALKNWMRETGNGVRAGGTGIRNAESGTRNPEPGTVILDAGSGFGQYTYFLTRLDRHANIDAVDIKEEQIADCTRFFNEIARTNVRFEVTDLTTFSRAERYDLILSVDVMEHILEDEQVFRNFHESLKPGGMLLISTPSDQGGSDVHDHDDDESFIDEHVRDGYGINEIREKLKKAGFDNIMAHYTYGKPGQLSWKLSMKVPVLMLNRSRLFFLILPFYYLLTFPVALIGNTLDLWMKHKTGTGLIVKAWKT